MGLPPAQMFSSDGPDWDVILSITFSSGSSGWERRLFIEDLLHFSMSNCSRMYPMPFVGPDGTTFATYVQRYWRTHAGRTKPRRARVVAASCSYALPHDPSTILLIDELENHLHPRWAQRLLLRSRRLLVAVQCSVYFHDT